MPVFLSLETLEPYVVTFTLVAGAAATIGFVGVNVPTLVATCWFLFLARARRNGPEVRWWNYLPSALLGVAGIGLSLVPVDPGPWKFAALAGLSAGAAWLLLPNGQGHPVPLEWSLRSG